MTVNWLHGSFDRRRSNLNRIRLGAHISGEKEHSKRFFPATICKRLSLWFDFIIRSANNFHRNIPRFLSDRRFVNRYERFRSELSSKCYNNLPDLYGISRFGEFKQFQKNILRSYRKRKIKKNDFYRVIMLETKKKRISNKN